MIYGALPPSKSRLSRLARPFFVLIFLRCRGNKRDKEATLLLSLLPHRHSAAVMRDRPSSSSSSSSYATTTCMEIRKRRGNRRRRRTGGSLVRGERRRKRDEEDVEGPSSSTTHPGEKEKEGGGASPPPVIALSIILRRRPTTSTSTDGKREGASTWDEIKSPRFLPYMDPLLKLGKGPPPRKTSQTWTAGWCFSLFLWLHVGFPWDMCAVGCE